MKTETHVSFKRAPRRFLSDFVIPERFCEEDPTELCQTRMLQMCSCHGKSFFQPIAPLRLSRRRRHKRRLSIHLLPV